MDSPKTTSDWITDGKAAGKEKDYGEAIRCFSHALADAPKDPDILTYIGIAYFLKGETQKAVEHLQESLRINGNQPLAKHYFNLCRPDSPFRPSLEYQNDDDEDLFHYEEPTPKGIYLPQAPRSRPGDHQRNPAGMELSHVASNQGMSVEVPRTRDGNVNVNVNINQDSGFQGAAVASVVFGIISIFFCPIFFTPVALILGCPAGARGNPLGWWGAGIGTFGLIFNVIYGMAVYGAI